MEENLFKLRFTKEQILKAIEGSNSMGEVGRRLGVNFYTIKVYFEIYGIPKFHGKKQYKPKVTRQEIVDAMASSYTMTQVCKKLNIGTVTYKKYCEMYGLIPLVKPPYEPRFENIINKDVLNGVNEQAKSLREACDLLGITRPTYLRYCERYGVEPVKMLTLKGIKTGGWTVEKIEQFTNELLEGKHPDYPMWKAKKNFVKIGYMEDKCSLCGFDEQRIIDNKKPLMMIMEEKTGDPTKDWNINNLKVYCYNCFFLTQRNIHLAVGKIPKKDINVSRYQSKKSSKNA